MKLMDLVFPERKELPYSIYLEKLDEQIRFALPFAGFLGFFAWIPYLVIDPLLHPEVAAKLIPLRIGLTACGLIVICAAHIRMLRSFAMPSYYLIANYLLQATPIITNLSGNDPEYLTGYQLSLLVVCVFPLRFTHGLLSIASSMVTFHVLAAVLDPGFFTRKYYSWGNLAISFFVSALIMYISERNRLQSEVRKRKLEETRLTLKRRTEQIENDMSIARLVQNNLLPASFPVTPNVEMGGFYQSMELIGGDFYDIHQLDEQRHLLFIADASGHGVSAALVAGMAKLSFYHAMEAGCQRPDELLKFMNREIKKFLRTEHFLTGFALLIDTNERVIEYCNAGHRPALCIDSEGNMRELDTPGTILGVVDDPGYELTTAHIENTEFFMLYTDGIVEARNRKGEEFGPGRLVQALLNYRKESITRIPTLIFSDLRAFSDGIVPGDDLTLLLARLK
ncbi:MAG: serine/threonine-protein phosphatase [Spirochaetia bacterium]|nr:serine/threonine-protein phosphatase [Spirochaetia bacterium]